MPLPDETIIPLQNKKWVHTRFPSNATNVWFSVKVKEWTSYYFWLIDSDATPGHVDLKIDACYATGGYLFNDIDKAWPVPRTFTAEKTGTVLFRAYPLSFGSAGTYSIVYSEEDKIPVNLPTVKDTVVPLKEKSWTNASLKSTDEFLFFSFNAVSGTTYYMWWNDADATNGYADIMTDVAFQDGQALFIRSNSQWANALEYRSDRTDKILIIAYPNPIGSSRAGTFSIAYSTVNTRPVVLPSPNETITPLKEKVWTNTRMQANENQLWYSINVTQGSTYYLWWNDKDVTATNMDIVVDALYRDGTTIFTRIDNAWGTPQRFTANRTGILLLRASPLQDSSRGAFSITFSNENKRP
jgi:hypothetical protein